MERCKTCKWWAKRGELRFSVCEHPKLGEDDGRDFGTDGLVYPYQEGAMFGAGPDFGCVHHANQTPQKQGRQSSPITDLDRRPKP